MEYSATVTCPNCGAPDTSYIEVDSQCLYITSICESCEEPYVLRIVTSYSVETFRLTKGAS